MKRVQLGWMVTAVVIAAFWQAPAIADRIVDYARNADRVDGIHAVRAGASENERERRLVATDGNGRLPDYIVEKVENSDNATTVDHYTSGRLVKTCRAGSVVAYASVPADVSGDWIAVDGVSMTRGTGGPPPLSGHPDDSCSVGGPRARRVGTGSYEVELFYGPCQASTGPTEAFIVSVKGAQPITATYESTCSGMQFVVSVRTFDVSGAPVDASFTIAALESPTILLP